jgi:hypothetical protein
VTGALRRDWGTDRRVEQAEAKVHEESAIRQPRREASENSNSASATSSILQT